MNAHVRRPVGGRVRRCGLITCQWTRFHGAGNSGRASPFHMLLLFTRNHHHPSYASTYTLMQQCQEMRLYGYAYVCDAESQQ